MDHKNKIIYYDIFVTDFACNCHYKENFHASNDENVTKIVTFPFEYRAVR